MDTVQWTEIPVQRDAPPIPDPQASATPERVAALIEALLVVDAMARRRAGCAAGAV
ncbi:hypothetical protein [Crenalkalicoccus roseus]|uniref:hypothetical protein n=1 Tax=Crenalkalicoccus roseus TaxID=1485588 RepID=UPI0013053F4E|nr:hypothetical protein [Crenalkalicoccus roseus]